MKCLPLRLLLIGGLLSGPLAAHATLLPSSDAIFLDLTKANVTDEKGLLRNLGSQSVSFDSTFMGSTSRYTLNTRLQMLNLIVPVGATYLTWDIDATYTGTENLAGLLVDLSSCYAVGENPHNTSRYARQSGSQAIDLRGCSVAPTELYINFLAPNLPDLFHFSATLSNLRYEFYPTLEEEFQQNLVTSVPEPGTLALFALGLSGMGLARRRRASVTGVSV